MAGIHIGPNGPDECRARFRKCKYAADGHYDSMEAAEDKFSQMMELESNGTSVRVPETVSLQLDFGAVDVKAGSLHDRHTRYIFANGLCGDLALSVQDRTGGQAFFVCEDADSIKTGELSETVAHAVIESPTHRGMYLDAYGLKTKDEIVAFYGFPSLIPVDRATLERYSSGGDHDVSSFAEAAINLDRRGRSYSYYDMPG